MQALPPSWVSMSNLNASFRTLYNRYRDETVILKATQYAKWTLPQLMVNIMFGSRGQAASVERDFQEIGALLVNNLGSKLCALLFPSSRPFYKIKAGATIKEAAAQNGVTETELAAGLAQLELQSCQQLFLNSSYEQLVMAVKHLIVTGNVLLFRDSATQKTHTYGLQSFGLRRDGRGNMMDCILREYTDFEALAPNIQRAIRAKNPSRYPRENEGNNRVELYTRIKRGWMSGNVVYIVTQEADEVPVGERSVYPEHLCPWQAPCWSLIAGENYGRGLVEDYAGGFAKLSDQSHASTLYGIAVAKVVNLVNPGQGADIDELANSETGDYVMGQEGAVSCYEAGDAKKIEQMRMEIETVFQRLAKAFMYKGNTRDAERVTAFELKQDALEAENTLGGTYSSLSAMMQVPMAHVLLTEVNPGMLEGIITKQIKLDIMAGIPALGRQADVQNLAAAAQDAAAIIPVLSQLSNRIDKEKVLDVILAGQSVDTTTIFKSKDQMAEEAKAQAQAATGEQQIQNSTTLADQAQQLQGIQG